MPSAAQILDRIMRLRMAGKVVRLTPHSAGVVESLMRSAMMAPAPAPSAGQLPYRFDEWDRDGGKIIQTHALIGDWEVAKAAWEVLKQHEHLTWRHGALVHAEQPWSDRFAKGVANGLP